MPATSIIIPVHGGAKLTRLCLNTLLRQQLEDTEVIVVDDASPDATPRLLEEYAGLIRVITHRTNVGFATSCNDGAAAAAGEHLVFLNNDTMPTEGWLGTLLRYSEEHPEAGVVGCKLLFPDDTVQHAGVVFNQEGHPHHVYHGFPADHPAVNKSRSFQCVTAACALIRSDLFARVGGFDPGFVNGFEDVDLCLRVRELGLESHYCHDCVVYHSESATRGWQAEEMNQNFELLRQRWGDRLLPDDVRFYVEDGLIELRYLGPGEVEVGVSPLIGKAAGSGDDMAAAKLLSRRSELIVELTQENEKLRRLAALPTRREDDLEWLVGGTGERTLAQGGLVPVDAGNGVVASAAGLRAAIAPLSLHVSERAPQRINLLVSADDYAAEDERAAVLHLGAGLVRAGWRVRAVAAEAGRDRDGDGARAEPGAPDEERFAGIEFVDRFDRSAALVVSPTDVFVAGAWWSAHLAHAAAQELGGGRFLYLIRGYEPLASPPGSHAAVAAESYGLSHVALFSTELLRDYFAERGLGVFGAGAKRGDRDAAVFEVPLTDVGEVTLSDLARRESKRLLLDARPGTAGGRNLVELGLLALSEAVEAGDLDGWQLTGVGAEERSTVELARDVSLELAPVPPRTRYRGLLRSHDVGVSLVQAPHPSSVAVEMASAGMPVVTTAFSDDEGAALRAISENLIPCPATLSGVREGLRRALARLPDHRGRADAAKVAWSRDWDESFEEATMQRVSRLLRRCVAGS